MSSECNFLWNAYTQFVKLLTFFPVRSYGKKVKTFTNCVCICLMRVVIVIVWWSQTFQNAFVPKYRPFHLISSGLIRNHTTPIIDSFVGHHPIHIDDCIPIHRVGCVLQLLTLNVNINWNQIESQCDVTIVTCYLKYICWANFCARIIRKLTRMIICCHFNLIGTSSISQLHHQYLSFLYLYELWPPLFSFCAFSF